MSYITTLLCHMKYHLEFKLRFSFSSSSIFETHFYFQLDCLFVVTLALSQGADYIFETHFYFQLDCLFVVTLALSQGAPTQSFFTFSNGTRV